MAMFIRMDTDDGVIRQTPGLAKKLAEVCPVGIFKLGSAPDSVETVEENLDECTLCDLCMQASPQGVRVVKLYER
jgi:NAD-dependent dihydropyrimidine dehydrogenase PreA subunit